MCAEALNTCMLAAACPANLDQTRHVEAEMLRLERAGLARSQMRNRPAVSTFWSGDGAQFRADVAGRREQSASQTPRHAQTLNGLETVLAIFDDDTERARGLLANQELDSDVEWGNHAWNTVLIEWLEGNPAAALPVMRSAAHYFAPRTFRSVHRAYGLRCLLCVGRKA